MNLLTKALAAALIAGGGWSLAGSANAVPLGRASLSLRDASTPVVETVQYRRRGWVGRRGVGVGLAVGAIAAGAIVASTYPAYSYGYPAYSYGYPAYSGYAPGYGYGYGLRFAVSRLWLWLQPGLLWRRLCSGLLRSAGFAPLVNHILLTSQVQALEAVGDF